VACLWPTALFTFPVKLTQVFGLRVKYRISRNFQLIQYKSDMFRPQNKLATSLHFLRARSECDVI